MSTTNSKHGIKAIIIATLMVIATLSIQYYIGIKQDEKKCAQIVDRELQIASMKIETYLSTTQQAIDNIDDQIIKNLHSTDSIYIIMKRIVASNKNITGCAIGFIPYYYPDKGYWFEPSAYRQNDTIKTMQAGSKNHDYFNMEWYTIEVDTGKFFDETDYADYRLYAQEGFTEDEFDKIAAINGVDAATRFFSVNLDIKGEKKKSLALDVSENYTVSTFITTKGADYDKNSDGIWLSDKFADANDLSVGDSLTLEYQNAEITG